MRILWRYILTRYLTALFSILLILTLSVLVVEILLDDEGILDSEAGLYTLLLKIFSSYLLQYLLPASALAGAFVCLGGAARASEITAMKAGGISPLVAVVPILCAAALLAGLSYVLGDTLVVMASQAWNRQTRGDASHIAVRRGTFWYHKGAYIYNFADRDPDGNTLNEVTVFELDDRFQLLRRIHAPRAIEQGPRWHFQQATIHYFDLQRPGQPPQIERNAEITLELEEGPSAALLQEEVAALRVSELRGLARGALHAVVIAFIYYSTRQFVSTLALEGVVRATAPWALLALFAGFGGFRLARVPR
jgi:lipopolysaccharide export system permease protein